MKYLALAVLSLVSISAFADGTVPLKNVVIPAVSFRNDMLFKMYVERKVYFSEGKLVADINENSSFEELEQAKTTLSTLDYCGLDLSYEAMSPNTFPSGTSTLPAITITKDLAAGTGDEFEDYNYNTKTITSLGFSNPLNTAGTNNYQDFESEQNDAIVKLTLFKVSCTKHSPTPGNSDFDKIKMELLRTSFGVK